MASPVHSTAAGMLLRCWQKWACVCNYVLVAQDATHVQHVLYWYKCQEYWNILTTCTLCTVYILVCRDTLMYCAQKPKGKSLKLYRIPLLPIPLFLSLISGMSCAYTHTHITWCLGTIVFLAMSVMLIYALSYVRLDRA